jgi:CelD/BcsL family acetyltransferase involved in cellulose biosynthesis
MSFGPQSEVEELALRVSEEPIGWIDANAALLLNLVSMQRDPSAFQTPAWLKSWWDVFGTNLEPRVVVVQRGSSVIGFAPLAKRRGTLFHSLEWVGSGRSDHAPLLLHPSHAAQAFEAIVAHLANQGDWALLSLRTLQEADVPSISACAATFGGVVTQEDVSPRVLVESSWDAYLAKKSSKHRSNLRRLLRQAGENAALEISCVTTADDALLRELDDVEKHSWKSSDGTLRMEGAGYRFYAAFLKAFSDEKCLEVWCCRHHEKLIAYLITFRINQRIFYYNGAYRAQTLDGMPGFSPGTALIASAIKSAHDGGMTSFDFLRGDEPYKQLWKNEDRALYHLVIPRPGIAGSLALLALRARWKLREYSWIRRLREKLLSARQARIVPVAAHRADVASVAEGHRHV